MPVKFTSFERAMIHDQLIVAGKKFFGSLGFKKTSIDSIVTDVGIGKGSFYLFFENKESLFFEILIEIEKEMHKSTIHELHRKAADKPFIDAFKTVMLQQIKSICTEPFILQSMEPTFITSIWKKLPQKNKEASIQLDLDKMLDYDQILRHHGYRFVYDHQMTTDILRSLAFNLLHPELMGPNYEKVSAFWVDITLEHILKKDL